MGRRTSSATIMIETLSASRPSKSAVLVAPQHALDARPRVRAAPEEHSTLPLRPVAACGAAAKPVPSLTAHCAPLQHPGELALGEHTFKSETLRQTLHPQWNEHFSFRGEEESGQRRGRRSRSVCILICNAGAHVRTHAHTHIHIFICPGGLSRPCSRRH